MEWTAQSLQEHSHPFPACWLNIALYVDLQPRFGYASGIARRKLYGSIPLNMFEPCLSVWLLDAYFIRSATHLNLAATPSKLPAESFLAKTLSDATLELDCFNKASASSANCQRIGVGNCRPSSPLLGPSVIWCQATHSSRNIKTRTPARPCTSLRANPFPNVLFG